LVKISKDWIEAGLRDKYPTLRADVDFLTSEGELIVRMNKVTLAERADQDEGKRDIIKIIGDTEPTAGTKTISYPRFEHIDDKESQYPNFKTITRGSQSRAKTKFGQKGKGKGKDMNFFEPGPLIDHKGKANTADFQLQPKADRKGRSKEISYFEPYHELNDTKKGKGKAKEISFFNPDPGFKKNKEPQTPSKSDRKSEGQKSGFLKPVNKQSSRFELRDSKGVPRRRMSTGRREREREGNFGMEGKVQMKREDVEMAYGSRMAGFVDLSGDD